jgi:GNAT superfamily N-acetyltransferase
MEGIPMDYRFIDEIAANAWPASITHRLGDWRLRGHYGVTKRANSVLAVGSMPEQKDWHHTIAHFYERLGLPPRFHISAASPDGLDRELADLGYVKHTECSLLIASTAEIYDSFSDSGRFSVELLDQADDSWMNDFLLLAGNDPQTRQAYQQLFSSMTGAKTFIRILDSGETAGMATAAAESGWAGYMNVVVAPERRRQGVGGLILRVLAGWSLDRGADLTYLQVEDDNAAALRLYASAGFQRLYGYHYRTLEKRE